jgi:hypothetical protein
MLTVSNEIISKAPVALIKRCTRMVKYGVAILDDMDPGSKNLLNGFVTSARMKGWFDVAIHGSDDTDPIGFFCIHSPAARSKRTRHYVTPEQLAQVVRQSGWRSIMPIRLYSCHGAYKDRYGIPIAQRLAKLLNTEVLASNKSNSNYNNTGFVALPPNWEPGPTEYTVFHPSENPSDWKVKLSGSAETIAKGTSDKNWHW